MACVEKDILDTLFFTDFCLYWCVCLQKAANSFTAYNWKMTLTIIIPLRISRRFLRLWLPKIPAMAAVKVAVFLAAFVMKWWGEENTAKIPLLSYIIHVYYYVT